MKIKCPYCGHVQEPFPGIFLCNNCYEDITDVLAGRARTEPFRKEISIKEAPGERKAPYLWEIGFFKTKAIHEPFPKLSGSGILFRRATGIFLNKFPGSFAAAVSAILSLTAMSVLYALSAALKANPGRIINDPSDLHFSGIDPGILKWIVAALNSPSLPTEAAVGSILCGLIFFHSVAVLTAHVAGKGFGASIAVSARRIVSFVLLLLTMLLIVGIGSMLFILPGIIAGICLVFAPFIFFSEEAALKDSLSRSIRYVKAAFLPVAFRLSFLPLLVLLLSSPIVYGAGLLTAWNPFLYFFVFASMASCFISFAASYLFAIYEGLKSAGLSAQAGEKSSPAALKSAQVACVAPGPATFRDILREAVGLLKEKKAAISILNAANSLPFIIHLLVLAAGYYGFRFAIFLLEQNFPGIGGEYGMLVFWRIPPEWKIYIVLSILAYCALSISAGFLSVMLFLHFDLAGVYVISGESATAAAAIKRARERLKQCGKKGIYWRFLVPGSIFWVGPWNRFTPFVLALDKDVTSLSEAVMKSKKLELGNWSRIFKMGIIFNEYPYALAAAVAVFILGGFPLYWLLSAALYMITGSEEIALSISFMMYNPLFWIVILGVGVMAGAFVYLPLTKAFTYVLLKETNGVASEGQTL